METPKQKRDRLLDPTGLETRDTSISMLALGGDLGEHLDKAQAAKPTPARPPSRIPGKVPLKTPKLDSLFRGGLKGLGFADLGLMGFEAGQLAFWPGFREAALERNQKMAEEGTLWQRQAHAQANPVTTLVGLADARMKLHEQTKSRRESTKGLARVKEVKLVMDHLRKKRGTLTPERKLLIQNTLSDMSAREVRKLYKSMQANKS
tara:strand:+ start:670 stop:1287 length:618 start_codon:yes stop_codon:yes gene_type:complete